MTAPVYHAEEIFPPKALHVHSPSIVELPGGELLACWFEGSGERTADDVVIMGARRPPGADRWGEPFLMASTEGFPDTNPVLFLDDRGVLWLFWAAVLANRWETSMLRYRKSVDYMQSGCPKWAWQDEIILKQRPDFPELVAKKFEAFRGLYPDRYPDWRDDLFKKAGDKYFRRLGWQTRCQPVIVGDGRYVLPVYSDGFRFSLMALTYDAGQTWEASEPLVGMGNIQPSVVQKKDGTLVAYMRDAGPARRVAVSESTDGGLTWSPVRSTEFPNPGSSVVVTCTADDHWLMLRNDSEVNRHNLLASLSEDEGKTWTHHRYLENDPRSEKATRSHYPTVIQGSDGCLHAVYSYHREDREERCRTIKYVRFNTAWVREGA